MSAPKLLSRDEFREGVFARDGHRCVLCGAPAQDVHHILERRLFEAPHEKGGYFLDNGASVCGPCHMRCERTEVSVEEVRAAAGITRVIVPSYLYDDTPYDKWGNPIMPNGQRTKGMLFDDESVQKVLAEGGALALFSKYIKYPRTSHLPWSPGMQSDDRQIVSMDAFIGEEVWVTEKADGEQATIYNDHYHARAIDTDPHPSRDRFKAFVATWQHGLADNERVNAENAYARHSIVYDESNPLPHFCLGFAMWRDMTCLSADETLENFAILGVTPVRTLYRGIYDEKLIRGLYDEARDWDRREGYVVRVAREFRYAEFSRCVAKYVRKGHVQTAKHHWKAQPVIPNVFERMD